MVSSEETVLVGLIAASVLSDCSSKAESKQSQFNSLPGCAVAIPANMT